MWLSFIELNKTVVLWSDWVVSVTVVPGCLPLMPSLSTCHIMWVSLTLCSCAVLEQRAAERRYPTSSAQEEILQVQCQEQWLWFAGAAVKRYPMSKVRESGQGHEKGSDLISGPRSVQSSVLSVSVTPWAAAFQVSLSITNFQSLLKLMAIELVMPSNHLILCHTLLLLPLIFPSIRVFSNESILLPIRFPKYWSFSLSINASSEYPGLIYFWIDWIDLLIVQGTLKSLLQHHSSKASIIGHPYPTLISCMTTWKAITLTKTFVDKVLSAF